MMDSSPLVKTAVNQLLTQLVQNPEVEETGDDTASTFEGSIEYHNVKSN